MHELLSVFLLYLIWYAYADPEGGGQRVRTPLEKSQNIGFLSNTGPDPLKAHKMLCTKSVCNVGPLSARQRNAIYMAFRWWADDGLLIALLGSYFPSSTKKKQEKSHQSGPPLTKLSGSVHSLQLDCSCNMVGVIKFILS